MLDLLLINPLWNFAKKNIWKEISGVLPPLGLASIAAFVREGGYQVKIIDMRAEKITLEDFVKNLRGIPEPRFIGITATTLPINNAYKIASIAKEVFSDAKIIFGGHHPTALPEEVIKRKEVDIVVRGEGEITVKEILDSKPLNEIDGIVYKDGGGQIVFNQEREPIKDINILPIPTYDLLPMEKYRPSIGSYKRLPAISLIASRGCPSKCTFCFRIFGEKVRIKSAENIYKEIKYLQENFGIKEIYFYDDNLTLFRDNLEKLCQMIIKNKTNISWCCFTKVNIVDFELFKLMEKAGCHQVVYGLESGEEKILKNLKKEINVELIKKAVFLTRKAGIDCRGAFMLGNPGDTEETIKKMIDFAIELDLDFATFNIAVPYPGTELFEWAKNNHYIKSFNWDLYDEATPLIELSTIDSKKIKELYHFAYKKFYLRLHYILKHIKKIKDFSSFVILGKGFLALIKFLKRQSWTI